MCRICGDVLGMAPGDALQVIGEAMAGASREELDHLLGLADELTPDYANDTFEDAMDADWERGYRGGQ